MLINNNQNNHHPKVSDGDTARNTAASAVCYEVSKKTMAETTAPGYYRVLKENRTTSTPVCKVSADKTAVPVSVTYQDIVEASKILSGVANRTPVATSRTLDKKLGGISCFLKCENLQRTGAFKFRGGYNTLSHFSKEQREAGVVTYSSGNHAQATALSASLLNMKATVFMPSDAPKSKVEATKGYGGTVMFYDRHSEDRLKVAANFQATTGAVLVSPHDDKYVISGQGTVGKELFEELESTRDMDGLDFLFVCVGGGGLISGCALAAAELSPNCKVIGVEPKTGNAAQQSIEQGRLVHIETPQTIADGARTQHIGQLTFQIMQQNVHKIITVTDNELVESMRFVGERMKMIVEPTGCLGLAGLQQLAANGEVPAGSKCGVIVSGGNVDMARYCELIMNQKS